MFASVSKIAEQSALHDTIIYIHLHSEHSSTQLRFLWFLSDFLLLVDFVQTAIPLTSDDLFVATQRSSSDRWFLMLRDTLAQIIGQKM